MIVFDLGCDHGHVFEAWFGSTEDYEQQRQRGMISCPICNSPEVDKAVMAPRVGRKSNQLASGGSASVPMARANAGPNPQQIKAMLEALVQAQSRALQGSQWVGSGFADEARAIHLGEADERPIHGSTTLDEAQSLIEEGIPVMPLPFPVVPPEAEN